jgi:hypothetical protein
MRKLYAVCIYIALFGLLATGTFELLHMPELAMAFAAISCLSLIFALIVFLFFPQSKYPVIEVKVIDVAPADLDLYTGTYTSQDLKMKIHVTKNETGSALLAQATGQGAHPLKAIDKHIFNHHGAGLIMEFRPDNNKFVLIENGGYFPFIKEA